MITFKLEVELKFEAENIKSAREKIKELTFLYKTLHNVDLKINENDRLFYEREKEVQNDRW